MRHRADAGGHQPSEAEERRIREAALDKTIEASFPASDPPSTNPNPDAHDAVLPDVRQAGDTGPNVDGIDPKAAAHPRPSAGNPPPASGQAD